MTLIAKKGRCPYCGRDETPIAQLCAKPDSIPSIAQETFDLYENVNSLMAHIGAHGNISSDSVLVDAVMNSLDALDGGKVSTRIDDLIEKAFMPADQATKLAVNEFILTAMAKPDSAVKQESGWLVENGKSGDALRYRTMSDEGIVWTANHMEALRFARRADAERFCAEDDEAERIAEHIWMGDVQTKPDSADQVPDVKFMVNRFLGWPLPKTFSPDCGISFDGRKNDEWNKSKQWPIGTNLLTADEAKEMFEYVLKSAAPLNIAQQAPDGYAQVPVWLRVPRYANDGQTRSDDGPYVSISDCNREANGKASENYPVAVAALQSQLSQAQEEIARLKEDTSKLVVSLCDILAWMDNMNYWCPEVDAAQAVILREQGRP